MDTSAADSARSRGLGPTSDEEDATIRIKDPTYDVDRIMLNLRGRLIEGSAQSSGDLSMNSYETIDADDHADLLPEELGSVPGSDNLAWQLFQAEAESRQNQVADQVRIANGLIGGVATQIRRPLHQLARFYANLIARKQRRVNDRLIQVARILKQRSDDDRETIATLRAEIALLYARLETVAHREVATPVGPKDDDTLGASKDL